MSRIGKKPIILPQGVSAKQDGGVLTVTGPKGSLSLNLHLKVTAAVSEKEVTVSVSKPEDKKEKALWGLFRSLIANLVAGVTQGFTKKLEINGVGFKVAVAGSKLSLALGFSHPVEVEIPQGLDVSVDKNLVSISGLDKQQVGQFAAEIRNLKPPEPYKGKGIKYLEEIIVRKAGKVVKAVGGGK